MAEREWAYLHGDFCPVEDATVNIRSKALNYGLGCFEGIRAYWNGDGNQLYIFRVHDHYKRMQNSCRILQFRLPADVDQLAEISAELCRRNDHREDVYIRPIVFNSSFLLSPMLAPEDSEFGIYTLPLRHYFGSSKGVTACVSSWRRVSDNMIPARAKPTGIYLNSALARYEAKANGYDEAILLTQQGYVSEASAEHLFIIRDGVLITPSAQDDNLEGITRDTLMRIAPAELNHRVIERKVSRTELYAADEAFLCGTGAEVTPLVMIDQRQIGDGSMGPITRELQDLFFKVVRAEVPKYEHWCTPVYK